MTANDSHNTQAPDSGNSPAPNDSPPAAPYLVLARKYRPGDFTSLIGQDAMVQTFANAFRTNRVHHAFMLTGVRGVGKTTTARILARAFNYEDENGRRPTLDLTRPGIHCQAIIEGRHVDVIEMDAASNTGIDDIREIIDSVKYAPASAPFKVYIIDEVHMLSRQAFNGLLKTLEEPPPHVKFIFATTEIRKVPVTVLSRCQRFDLRRIPHDIMTSYLVELLEKESITVEPDALSLIVRAGEGSVRDCLSLADQAIAHGNGTIATGAVQDMLGLADSARIIDLFEDLMAGNIGDALDLGRSLYDAGTDPQAMVADLARLTHLLTRFKIVPETEQDASLTPHERQRGAELAEKLNLRVMTRTWQLLLSGLKEVASAPNPMQALDMLLVRIAHAADLPTPDELVTRLQNKPQGAPDSSGTPVPGTPAPERSSTQDVHPARIGRGMRKANPEPARDPSDASQKRADQAQDLCEVTSFDQLVALVGQKRELEIKYALENHVRPVRFKPGHMEISLEREAGKTVIGDLSARLKQWTGRNWLITVLNETSKANKNKVPTVRERQEAEKKVLFERALKDPMVQAVMNEFAGAELVSVEELKSGGGSDDAPAFLKQVKQQEDR